MLVHQAYRYELDPTASQRVLLAKHAGTARFAFNWGLALCKERLEHQESVPHGAELHRLWNIFKRGNAPWWVEVSKCSPQESLRDLDRAFGNFWRGRATDKFRGRILSASISREADRWYVSLTVERERPDPVPVAGPVVGVDLGLSSFAVLSDGTVLESPKALDRSLRRLQRVSKAHSRKQRGSHNRRKSAMRLARLHRRIRNQRQDFLHQATTALAKTKSVIVVEDLNVRGMVRNRHLARHISDAGWSEFRRMLAYKTEWYGSHLVVAPRFFASSKTCSACGAVKDELDLSERAYRCAECGMVLDRDLNAARNLAHLVAGSSPDTLNACGGRVRPDVA